MHFCNATRTFYEVKCSASHFPKENVQQNKMLQMHLMLPLHFVGAEHFPKENVQLCKNAFDAKMHLMQKCIFATQRCAKMHLMRTFCNTKCYKCIFATHHILRSKMFSITFDFVKCSATLSAKPSFCSP